MEILHRMSPVGVECRQASAPSPALSSLRLPRRSSRLSAALRTSRLHHGLVANPNLVLHLSLFKLQQMHFNTHRGWSSSLLRQRQLMAVVSQVMTELSRAQSPAVVAPTNVQLARSAQPPEQAATATTPVPLSEGSFQTAVDGSTSVVQRALYLNDESGASPRVHSEVCLHTDVNSTARLRLGSDDSGVDCDEVICVDDVATHSWEEERIEGQSLSNDAPGDMNRDRLSGPATKRRSHLSTVGEDAEQDLQSEAKRHCSTRVGRGNATERPLRPAPIRAAALTGAYSLPKARLLQDPDISCRGAEAGESLNEGSCCNASPEGTGRLCDKRVLARRRAADLHSSVERRSRNHALQGPAVTST